MVGSLKVDNTVYCYLTFVLSSIGSSGLKMYLCELKSAVGPKYLGRISFFSTF
jgi:hypothetical protein